VAFLSASPHAASPSPNGARMGGDGRLMLGREWTKRDQQRANAKSLLRTVDIAENAPVSFCLSIRASDPGRFLGSLDPIEFGRIVVENHARDLDCASSRYFAVTDHGVQRDGERLARFIR
jgi:hypothetical protein